MPSTQLAIRGIGQTTFSVNISKLANVEETEISNLFTAKFQDNDDKLHYFYKYKNIQGEEKYLKISGPVADIIEHGGTRQKSFFEHLQALNHPRGDCFSASLLHQTTTLNPTRLYTENCSDKFGLILPIDEGTLRLGCNKTDGYSGCFDLANEGIAFYGLFGKYLEISGKLDETINKFPNIWKHEEGNRFFYGNVQEVCRELGITRGDFEKVINEEFEKNDGKIEITHIHAMDENLTKTTFYNSLERMTNDNASGEILIHQLHNNQNDVILMLPQKYQVGMTIAEYDLDIAIGLKKFYEENTSRSVRFATLDASKHVVTIVELDERGVVKKSANQDIQYKPKDPTASPSSPNSRLGEKLSDLRLS